MFDPGSSKTLETISRNASAQVIPFIKTVMTIDLARHATAAKEFYRCVVPVSLERVAQ